jgi:Protein of unknown function (DUF2905)
MCGRGSGDAEPTRDGPRDRIVAKVLILIGLALVVVGLIWLAGERLGLGRLPGDFVIEREGFRLYIPLMTSLIVSVVLSLLLWFFGRW